MPDTKTGRERKGLNKEAQLERRLARRDLRKLGEDAEESWFEPGEADDADLLADPDESLEYDL